MKLSLPTIILLASLIEASRVGNPKPTSKEEEEISIGEPYHVAVKTIEEVEKEEAFHRYMENLDAIKKDNYNRRHPEVVAEEKRRKEAITRKAIYDNEIRKRSLAAKAQAKVTEVEDEFEFVEGTPTKEYREALKLAAGKPEHHIWTHYFVLTHPDIFEVTGKGTLGLRQDANVERLFNGGQARSLNVQEYRKRLEQFVKLHNEYKAPLFIAKDGTIVHHERPSNRLSPVIKVSGPIEVILDFLVTGEMQLKGLTLTSKRKDVDLLLRHAFKRGIPLFITMDPKDELNEGRVESKREYEEELKKQKPRKGIVSRAIGWTLSWFG